MATVVPIDQVRLWEGEPSWTRQPSRYMLSRMRQLLERQGQIEPLQVRQVGPAEYETFERDPWGDEIVRAARQLRWPTLLIVAVDRYRD